MRTSITFLLLLVLLAFFSLPAAGIFCPYESEGPLRTEHPFMGDSEWDLKFVFVSFPNMDQEERDINPSYSRLEAIKG